MSKREYTLASGVKERIEITSDGDDVRVRVIVTDYDGIEHGGMVDMPITDLRDMFKEADDEEATRRGRGGIFQSPAFIKVR